MGKHSQTRNTNAAPHDKTNPTFKWARMLHLLDYHRWHYVKKVLAHTKPNEGKNGTETDSIALDTCEHHPYATNEVTDSSAIGEHTTDPSSSSKCSPSPSSPRTKSSRAARIRKMIAKEVTKRRGRHRRSSTCPAVSEIAATDSVHDHELTSEKLSRNSSVDQRDNQKCGLCNTMQIECQLGERKQVGDQGDHDHHINMLLQEIPDEAINQFSFDNKNITRITSLQHSNEFLDAMDVLSINKQFFLRVLDDPSSSLRHNFLAQQSSNKRKSLAKSGTFPVTYGPLSSMTDSSPTLLKPKHKSYAKEIQTSSNQTQIEKPITNSHHDDRVVGKRFKDLRQKLKHVIKESRKERRRIAMDGVLHRVPYGQKAVIDESGSKDSPRVSTCESDLSASPCSSIKDGRKRNRRSPSLDGSLERYCQLFETTTSFNRVEPNKMADTNPERSRLKVMDENSSKRALGRIFSSPDLQVFLSHWPEDFDGLIPSRTPNRDIMSFNAQKMQEVALNMDLKSGKLSSHPPEDDTCKEDLEQDVGNEEITIDDPSKEEFQTPKSLEVAPCDDITSVITTQTKLIPIIEPAPMPEFDDQTVLVGLEETILEDDAGSTHDKQQETSNESPTFSCTKVDDDQVETTQTEAISPTLHPVKVCIEDEAEFNYVKDILHLSGYSGSQLLGTWYSSDQPVNPSVFVELESGSLLEPTTYSPSKDGCVNSSSHLLLFDLINEILLAIYERSVSYWSAPLSLCSRMHPMPKGYRVLEEVWASINWYMACSTTPQLHSCLDYTATRDLAKDDGWMNLQFDAECVGLEVDDLIFDDLLTELLS